MIMNLFSLVDSHFGSRFIGSVVFQLFSDILQELVCEINLTNHLIDWTIIPLSSI